MALRRRPVGRGIAVAAGTVVVLGLCAGCVRQSPPRSAPGTTTFASPAFCEPVRALSVDAWADQASRAPVAVDLAAARSHAPASLHPALDTLIELEKAGVHPGAEGPPVATSGTEPAALARWFDAMGTLSAVAERECNVDLAAGDGAGSAPGAPRIDAKPAGSSGLTPAEVADLVRAARPEARWVERPVIGAVASGDAVQVSVVDVDDAATAMQICTDLLAALPTEAAPPLVTVRNTPGVVLVGGDADGCAEVPHP